MDRLAQSTRNECQKVQREEGNGSAKAVEGAEEIRKIEAV